MISNTVKFCLAKYIWFHGWTKPEFWQRRNKKKYCIQETLNLLTIIGLIQKWTEINRTDSTHFSMGRDCLGVSEEQHRKWTAQLICSSFLFGTRLPLGQWGTKGVEWNVYSLFCSFVSQRQSPPIQKQGADQLCSLVPCCPRGSLVPYKSEEHQFFWALLTERTVCVIVS